MATDQAENRTTDVTIIIPNHNGADDLRTCLRALEQQTHPADVIVVDDGSTDDSADIARTFETRAENGSPEAGEASGKGGIRSLVVLQHTSNRGFAAAVNTGIRKATTPYVILLNNDTEAEADFTKQLVRAIKRRKNAFAVQAMLVQAGTDIIDSSGDYFCALGWAFSPGRDKPVSAYERPARIMSACAGAAIYDRMTLEELDLFDEAHFCYLEDVDLSLRAYRAGYRIYYEPAARVYHKASASSGSRYNAFKTRLTTANSLYTVYKNLPAWMIVLYAPLLFAGFAIKGAFYARQGLGSDFLGGLREGFAKIASCRKTGDIFHVEAPARREAMLAMELLGNCVRRIAG